MIFIGILKQLLYNLNTSFPIQDLLDLMEFLKKFESDEEEDAVWDPTKATAKDIRFIDKDNQVIITTLRKLGFEFEAKEGLFVVSMDKKILSIEEVNFLVGQLDQFVKTHKDTYKSKELLEKEEEEKKLKKREKRIRKKLRLIFNSKPYFVMLILYTSFVLVISILVKFFDYLGGVVSDEDSKKGLSTTGFVFGVLYAVLQVTLLVEIIFRAIIIGVKFLYDKEADSLSGKINWRHILDAGIVIGDFLLTYMLIILWAAGVGILENPIDNIGILSFMRLGVFMLYHKKLSGVVFGMLDSLTNFLMSFFFLFMIIYMFGVMAKVIYTSPCDGKITPEDENEDPDPFCLRFKDFYESVFSMYQVMTSESWAEMFSRPAEEKVFGSYVFFTFFHAMTSYVLLNVISGLVVDSIMAKAKKEEEKKQALEEKRLEELEESLPDIYLNNALPSQPEVESLVPQKESKEHLGPSIQSEDFHELVRRLIRIEEKVNYLTRKGRLFGY